LSRHPQKVFITGASGFVGRHLIDALLLLGCEISGTSYPEKPENCGFKAEVAKNIVHLDIRSEKGVHTAIKNARPDWIFHLAAISNVRVSWEKRKETLQTNLMGTFNLLEAVRKNTPDARVLFVSSSDLYGILTPIERALKEEDSLCALSPYAFTKASGEMLCRFYAQVEGLDIVIARSFPHTGPGQTPDFVCADWASQIALIEKGLSPPVVKVGNTAVRRDFSDVRDVVQAYIRLLEKGRKGEVYNVCSGRAQSLQEILDKLVSFSSKKITVEVDKRKLRKADIPLLLGDNRKIREETGWMPKIPLEKTLRDLFDEELEKLGTVPNSKC